MLLCFKTKTGGRRGGGVEVPNKRLIEAKRGYLKRGEVKRGYRRALLGLRRNALKTGFSMPLFELFQKCSR